MKKKLVALTLSLVLALSLAACGGKEEKAETAETEATTEAAEEPVAAEAMEEAEPVEEEPEVEVAEEAPEEEVVEEEPAPTNEEIVRDFKNSAEIGDFMIDENDVLIVKTSDSPGYQFVSCESIMIDDQVYGIIDHMECSEDPWYIDTDLGTNISDIVYSIPNESIPMYVRRVMGDNPDTVKISVIVPEESVNKISDYVAQIGEISYSTSYWYAGQWISINGCWIPCEEFQDGKVTFTTNVSFEEGFPQNPEALTATLATRDNNHIPALYRVLQEHVGGNGIGKSKEYTIIDD